MPWPSWLDQVGIRKLPCPVWRRNWWWKLNVYLTMKKVAFSPSPIFFLIINCSPLSTWCAALSHPPACKPYNHLSLINHFLFITLPLTKFFLYWNLPNWSSLEPLLPANHISVVSQWLLIQISVKVISKFLERRFKGTEHWSSKFLVSPCSLNFRKRFTEEQKGEVLSQMTRPGFKPHPVYFWLFACCKPCDSCCLKPESQALWGSFFSESKRYREKQAWFQRHGRKER